MKNFDPMDYVPKQKEGAESNTVAEKHFDDEAAAKPFFEKAAKRLLSVNDWRSFTGMLTADFQLCDSRGNEMERAVQLHDHLRIDVPGPGSSPGDGYDWVHVEALERFLSPDVEMLLMRVRPVSNPSNADTDVAHFFTDESTSTFIVSRTGNHVAASVHGRNEKPNLYTDSLADKARNIFTGVVAAGLFSKYQWSSLVKGLLDFEL